MKSAQERIKSNKRKMGSMAELMANYLLDDREESDYLRHCEENDLNPEDFYNNAEIEGAHIYAVAKKYLFLVEQTEQIEAEGNI